MRAIRKGVLWAVGMDIVMETWRRERMSRPSKGMGHWGITRKEWEKGMGLSRIVHKRGGFNGKICLPPTPTIGVMAGVVGPRFSHKTEKVAPVSRRKEMGRPSTVKVTLGSCLVMEMVGREAPGPC